MLLLWVRRNDANTRRFQALASFWRHSETALYTRTIQRKPQSQTARETSACYASPSFPIPIEFLFSKSHWARLKAFRTLKTDRKNEPQSLEPFPCQANSQFRTDALYKLFGFACTILLQPGINNLVFYRPFLFNRLASVARRACFLCSVYSGVSSGRHPLPKYRPLPSKFQHEIWGSLEDGPRQSKIFPIV